MSGNPQAQWAINSNQALLEERKRGPLVCKMCHKNPAEYSGYCGDCYQKLGEDENRKKAAKHRFLRLSFFHLFDR